MNTAFHVDLLISLEPLLPASAPRPTMAEVRSAQEAWGGVGVRERLRVLRRARARMVSQARELAETVPLQVAGSLHRNVADTLVAEVLPLIEACRFLERKAESILRPRRAAGRSPLWLRGVSVEVRREALGVVLIIAPGNYPLFLPGVQALQALAAGNAVLWKPAAGGQAAGRALREMLVGAGLNPLLLQVLDDSAEAATEAIRGRVDKVVLTGSAATGRAVLRELAETLTPAVMELSGCDAVFVLDDADLDRAAAAIAFGLRLNGSATCMAPRRLFASRETAARLLPKLIPLLEAIEPVPLTARTAQTLRNLVEAAERGGATLACGGIDGSTMLPMLITGATPDMQLTPTDLAAPVLSLIEVAEEDSALAAYNQCPYALTAAVFGREEEAARLAARIAAGVVVVNDIIVGTADPRAPFGGRKGSGFGVTRGREGLLEMTAVKTVILQRSRDRRAYQPTGSGHADLFLAYLRTAHGSGLRERLAGLRQLAKAAKNMGKTGPGTSRK